MLRLTGPIVIIFALVACSPSSSTPTTISSAPSSTTVPTTSTSQADVDVDVCVQGDLPFGGEGLIAAVGEDDGDATQIAQIRWDGAGTCERITIAFSNDNGAPATTLGPTAVSVLEFSGVVRITLPDEAVATAVADTLFEGSLIERAYVVRSLSDGLTIDLRTAEGVTVEARAFTTTSPSTLVVDVMHGGNDSTSAGAALSQTAVVVTPVPGPNLYPLTVEGYVTPGLRSIHLILGVEDSDTLDLAVALEGYTDAWQGFRTDLPDGPSGHATLFVGVVDTNGRPLDGASVSLDMP
ncbi:MAG: hypothetical protein M3094_09440 [Actinomycetia bacterium]|nr:hypothetical protein [Actinomycetes bacterium]